MATKAAISGFERIVKAYIESTGCSYKDLGAIAEVHPSQISKFMKAERGLTSLSIGRIVDALGCRLLRPTRKFQPPTVGRPRAPIVIWPSDLERNVSEYIRSTGVSYHELGEIAGVHPSQISKFMKGERGLSSLSIGRLVDALGCPLLPPTRKFKPVTVGRPKTPVTDTGVRAMTG
jgi:plasmid maintenance system antidote protein VapI